MAGLHDPLPTLRRYPRGCRRTARGRCGSLFLHRISPPTPCQSPGALPQFLVLSSQIGLVKKAANGASQCIRIGGTGSINDLQLFRADKRRRAGASPWPAPIRCWGVSKPSTAAGAAACAANGYSLHSERSGGPVARFKPTGEDDKIRVLAWLASREMGCQWTVRRPHHDARPRPELYRFKPVPLDSLLIQMKNAQS